MYVLKPGATQEEKVRIEAKEMLENILQYIDQNEENPEALQVLYVYPEDGSPTSSPAKVAFEYAEENTNESSSDKKSSVKSDRSTYQKRFKKEVLHRDENRCRLCGESNSLMGAHIVNASMKFTPDELHDLGLSHKYEIWNGICLCANCHHQYDHWQLGIDSNGFLWKKVDGQWTKDPELNIYPAALNFTENRRYPDPILLDWKFSRFIDQRDKVITRIANGFTSLFISTPPKKEGCKSGRKS